MATPERSRNQAEVDDLLSKIKLASEHIFAAVHAPDDGLSLAEIQQKIQWQKPLYDWALGYLAGLGDIEISENERGILVRRKWSHYPFFAKHEE